MMDIDAKTFRHLLLLSFTGLKSRLLEMGADSSMIGFAGTPSSTFMVALVIEFTSFAV